MNTNSAGISKNRKISPIVPKRTDTPRLTKRITVRMLKQRNKGNRGNGTRGSLTHY